MTQTHPTSEARIDWLLSLQHTDVTAMRPGALFDMSADAAAHLFTTKDRIESTSRDFDAVDDLAILHTHAQPADEATTPDYLKGRDYEIPTIDPDELPRIPRAALVELQTWLRAGLAELHAGRQWAPFPKAAPTPLTLQMNADRTLTRTYRGSGDDVLTMLKLGAVDLIVEWWPQLRQCAKPGCGITFRPTHGKQKFHDPRCSDAERQRKYRPHRPKRNHTEEKIDRITQRKAKKRKKGDD